MRGLVGAIGMRAACGRNVGSEQVRSVAELLVSAVCGRRVRTPSSIDLRILVISIIFGVNFCYVNILLVIYAFLHRKSESHFGRGQFG